MIEQYDFVIFGDGNYLYKLLMNKKNKIEKIETKKIILLSKLISHFFLDIDLNLLLGDPILGLSLIINFFPFSSPIEQFPIAFPITFSFSFSLFFLAIS